MNVNKLIVKKSYERIEYVLRRHPITFVPIISLTLTLLLAPVAVYLLLQRLQPLLFGQQTWFTLLVILGLIYYLSIYMFFFTHFIDFYLDLWIVTNDRIVDIEQQGVLSRTITELDLFQIQDITTQVRGFFRTIFNYGQLQIKTASTNQEIIFRNIHNPNRIRERLLILAQEDRKYHPVMAPHLN